MGDRDTNGIVHRIFSKSPENGAVRVQRGVMHFVAFGHGDRALILLPGLSESLVRIQGKALLIAPSYKTFFQSYRVYLFARLDTLPADYTLRDMADDQAQAMQALNLQHACVMGVSQGGMIAQLLTLYYPQLVEKLVLVVTAPRCSDLLRHCACHWIDLVERGEQKAMLIDTIERSYAPARLAVYRKAYPFLGLLWRETMRDRFLVQARALLSFDVQSEVSQIACPSLILGGAEDRIVGVDASWELRRRIPGSRLHIYPGLGHAAYEEAPDFQRRALCFLQRDAG